MPCSRGCCDSPAEHYRSVAVRTGPPKTKVTVDHTDETVNTVTDYWHDRQDVHIDVLKPITTKRPPKEGTDGR